MIDYFKQLLVGQYEAALCMLDQCITACPAENWEGRVGNETFRWGVYHTLFFTDLYLSPNNEAFELRELHERGGDEREDRAFLGLEKDEALVYVQVCREKALGAIAAETAKSLEGPSGFHWYKFTRGEMYFVNIRHIQHHAAQLSAFLRRFDKSLVDHKLLYWVGSGWRPH